MVMSCPYHVPPWMPAVLVTLSSCINDPPPISASTRKVFAEFMRTHRDEWSVHKRAFSEDELECVSELMVSPSYYA
jgi:proteasome activator subunit 4